MTEPVTTIAAGLEALRGKVLHARPGAAAARQIILASAKRVDPLIAELADMSLTLRQRIEQAPPQPPLDPFGRMKTASAGDRADAWRRLVDPFYIHGYGEPGDIVAEEIKTTGAFIQPHVAPTITQQLFAGPWAYNALWLIIEAPDYLDLVGRVSAALSTNGIRPTVDDRPPTNLAAAVLEEGARVMRLIADSHYRAT